MASERYAMNDRGNMHHKAQVSRKCLKLFFFHISCAHFAFVNSFYFLCLFPAIALIYYHFNMVNLINLYLIFISHYFGRCTTY